jgi:mannitol-1-phosphate 5-dehydrogenase
LKKLILFGAGKIGRSFIGQLFSRGGYEVVFVDVDKELIDELNRKKLYRVIVCEEAGNEELVIRNVRGIHAEEKEIIMHEIAGSSLMATAVGKSNLESAIKLMAAGINFKRQNGIDPRTDIILAENVRNASDVVRDLLISQIHDREFVENNIGLIETSIGKMVPIMSREDMENDRLAIYAERYNTLILDKKGFKNPIPAVEGLAPRENMKAWVDRKSFIHNLGHAAVAYYGYIKFPGRKYLFELLRDKEIYQITRNTMLQSAEALICEYPGEFTIKSLTDHIGDLIRRFSNRSLADTVFRVGMDLYRKLGYEDRLVGAIRMAKRHNLSFDKISFILACGMHFRSTDDSGKLHPADADFIEKYQFAQPEKILREVCGMDPVRDKNIFDSVITANNSLINEKIIK